MEMSRPKLLRKRTSEPGPDVTSLSCLLAGIASCHGKASRMIQRDLDAAGLWQHDAPRRW